MNNFVANFQKYSLPKIGYIKIPKIFPTKAEISNFNLQTDDSSNFLCALARGRLNKWLEVYKVDRCDYEEYYKRIDFEISEIIKLKFVDYILTVYRIIEFCKRNNILTSPARGSCGGSLLLAVIGITSKIDPLKMDLLFERFISSARTEVKVIDGEEYISSSGLPDIDLDIDQRFKSEVFSFLESLFPKRVSHIANISTFQSKVLLKEVLKSYKNFSEDESKHVSDLIETKFGRVQDIKEALIDNQPFIDWSKENQDIIDICLPLNGLSKNRSVHAAGIILCNEEIDESIPLELSSDKRVVTAYDMESAQCLGIKVDILSLKNLSSIQSTLAMVDLSMEDIDINDKSIYEFINTNDQFYGIFQAEEVLGKSVLKKIKPQSIDDVAVSVALGRPGCMSLIDSYLQFNPESLNEVDERVRPILAKDRNCIIFQEVIMKLAKVMADFTPIEADGLRRGIGKKIVKKVLEYKDKFIENSLKNGYKEEFVKWCWDIFEASGNYNFNRSHAVGYGALLAICAYLKANHPLPYFLNLLKCAKNEQSPMEEICKIHSELPFFGIHLLPPHILRSSIDYSIEGNDIRIGLSAIKGISEKSIEKLNKFRTTGQTDKFSTFFASNEAKLPLNILSAIILTGALDDQLTQTRAKTFMEACLFSLLKPKEKNWAKTLGPEYNYDLIAIVKALNEKLKDEKGRPIIKDTRRATIRKHFAPYQKIYEYNKKNEKLCAFICERFLLGFSYTTNLYEIFSPVVEGLYTIFTVGGFPDGEEVRVVGEVVEAKLGKSKEKKTPYLKLDIKDHTGNLRVMAFDTDRSKSIEECKLSNGRLPKEGDCVVVRGIKKDGNCIFARAIGIQPTEVFLRVSELPEPEKEKDE